MTEKEFGKSEFIASIPKKAEFSKYRHEDDLSDILGFRPRSYQKISRNFLHPLSPARNVLIFGGTGSGKTATSLLISEAYASHLKSFHIGGGKTSNKSGETRFQSGYIHIVTKTSQAMHQFIETLIQPEVSNYEYVRKKEYKKYLTLKRTFDTNPTDQNYKRFKLYYQHLKTEILSPENGCFYKFLKYASFRRLVERIPKTEKLDISNSLFIFDEAHEIEGNKAEITLNRIKRDSSNVRIILLSATPMMTNPSETVRILNFLRPPEDQLKQEDFFTREETVKKKGVVAKLGEFSRGYVSSVEISGNLFPDLNIKGRILPGMKNVKLVECLASDLQEQALDDYIENLLANQKTDGKNKSGLTSTTLLSSGAQRNTIHIDLVIPIESKGRKKNSALFYSQNAINDILKHTTAGTIIIEKMGKIGKILGRSSILECNAYRANSPRNKRTIGIEDISAKYANMLDVLFSGMKENLGKSLIIHRSIGNGIFLISSILSSNGFSRFPDIRDDDKAICYQCGRQKRFHGNKKERGHKFSPAVYLPYYSKTTQAERKRVINIFNSRDNLKGRLIKVVVGSSIIRESIDFNAIREIHIMVPQESLNMDKQVIGRGVRLQSHAMLPSSERNVAVYRYATIFPRLEKERKLQSPDKYIYAQQEERFLLIGELEESLRRNAFDCPMNAYLNVSGTKRLLSRSKNKCLAGPLPPIKKLNTDTDLFIDGAIQFDENKRLIRYIFSFTSSLSDSGLVREVISLRTEMNSGELPFVTSADILMAVREMVLGKEVFSNVYGVTGHLEHSGHYIVFIPENSPSAITVSNIYPVKTMNKMDISGVLGDFSSAMNKIAVNETGEELRKMMSETDGKQERAFNKKFMDLGIEERIAVVESLIESNDQKLLHSFPSEIRKFFVSPLKIGDESGVFKIRTGGTFMSNGKSSRKKNDYYGHVLGGEIRCYDRLIKDWVDNCLSAYSISYESKFILDSYVGFDEIGSGGRTRFKIWINSGNPSKAVVDMRKERKGLACSSFLSSEDKVKLFKFIGYSPEKRKDGDTKVGHKELCTILRKLFIERNSKFAKKVEKGRERKICFLSVVDRTFARKAGLINF